MSQQGRKAVKGLSRVQVCTTSSCSDSRGEVELFLVFVPAKTDSDLKAFLDERNPKQQHSSTLESYLIKPIQRVLKYPLLLKELYALTDPDSEEHYHLDGKSHRGGGPGGSVRR